MAKSTGTGNKRGDSNVPDLGMSVGNVYSRPAAQPKNPEVKTRGSGAATKGVTSRGPLA